jgi:hypothetical protein
MCRICNSFALIDPRAIDLAAAFMQRPYLSSFHERNEFVE